MQLSVREAGGETRSQQVVYERVLNAESVVIVKTETNKVFGLFVRPEL